MSVFLCTLLLPAARIDGMEKWLHNCYCKNWLKENSPLSLISILTETLKSSFSTNQIAQTKYNNEKMEMSGMNCIFQNIGIAGLYDVLSSKPVLNKVWKHNFCVHVFYLLTQYLHRKFLRPIHIHYTDQAERSAEHEIKTVNKY